MKIRIKGNSIRIRITKSEVAELASSGYLQELTHFPDAILTYELKTKDEPELGTSFINNTITMYVPATFLQAWPDNTVTGLRSVIRTGDHDLILLLEKDFVCLDETTEDQSDNYENPNKTC